MSQIYKQDYISGGLLGVIDQPTGGSTGIPANALVLSIDNKVYKNDGSFRTITSTEDFTSQWTLVIDASAKADTDLSNVDSDLSDAEKLAIRNKIGAGTGGGSSHVDGLLITGNQLRVSEDGSAVGTGVTVETRAVEDSVNLITSGGVFDTVATRVALTPTSKQTIDGETAFQGSTDFEMNNGQKIIDISGSEGDVHFVGDGTTENDKFLFDRSTGKVHYDPTNNVSTLLGTDGNEIAVKGDLTALADEITAIEIQRNSAGQSLEQWEQAGNPASTFVADSSNSLTEVSLANNLNLLANDNYSKMIVATENGNNYHFDLLYFAAKGGRLVLQTDNLVTRLTNIDTAITTAGTTADNVVDENSSFTITSGTTGTNTGSVDSSGNVTLSIETSGGDGIAKVADLSSTTLPNPQEGDVVYLTADWTDTSGATDVKYYEGLHTYNGSLWVGVLNLPIIASGYPAGTYDSSVPFLNDSTMLAEEITAAGIHRVGSDFELVGNWQTRTEDLNKLILDINVGTDSGDIDIYDTEGEVVMHLDSSGKKMYYGSNINTTSLNANDEIATLGDVQSFNPTEYDPTQVYQTGALVTADGELFQCTATTTALPGNVTIETQGDNWRSITETLASVDSVATFPLLTPDNSIIRVGEIMCVINDPSPYNNGLYRVVTHNASGTSVARVDELNHLHEIVEGIIQHSGSSASFEFPDDNPAFITGTLVDETKFTTVEGTKSTTIPSLDTVGPKFEPENGRMTLIYSNLSDEQITQLEAAVGSDLAFRTTAGGVVTAGNVEDTDNAVAAQSTYHFLLKSVSYRLGTGRRQLNFVMRDLSQATDFVSAFTFLQNTGITGNANNLYIPTDGPLVTNLIDNISLVTIVAISGGGGGNVVFGNDPGEINPFAEGGNTERWPDSKIPADVVYDADIANFITSNDVPDNYIQAIAHPTLGQITITSVVNGVAQSPETISTDHVYYRSEYSESEWGTAGMPANTLGLPGALAFDNTTDANAAVAYRKNSTGVSGTWVILPLAVSSTVVTGWSNPGGTNTNPVLQPTASGQNAVIGKHDGTLTIDDIQFDALKYTAMLVGVGSSEITTTAAGYETDGLSYSHNSVTYYRLFLADGTGEILTTNQNNTDAGDIVYSKTY